VILVLLYSSVSSVLKITYFAAFWLGFFRKAGITSGFDAKYALVFDENRITMDILKDINKECLKDMGITAMGDIIAILKHAKIVHEEASCAFLLIIYYLYMIENNVKSFL
jgi:hypothetical protein